MTDKIKKCFVIGPIGKDGGEHRIHADWLYQGIIEPLFEAQFPEFEINRADKIAAPGLIDHQIIQHLAEDDVVIADLSFGNANAFYELGIRHMAGKPIIHMFLEGTDIPFDVKLHRAVPFSRLHPNDLMAAKTSLLAAMREVTKDGFKVENPVTNALGQLKLRAGASTETQVIMDKLNSLAADVARIQNSESRRPPRDIRFNFGENVPKSPTYVEIRFGDEPNDEHLEKLRRLIQNIASTKTSLVARSGMRFLFRVDNDLTDSIVLDSLINRLKSHNGIVDASLFADSKFGSFDIAGISLSSSPSA